MLSAHETILNELKESYNEGKIDEATYMELRQKYINQMEKKSKVKEPETFIQYKSMGGHSVSSETMRFSGAARLPGGVVPRFVRVSGACKIKDDIEVNGIHCSGLLRSAGAIISHGDINVSGAFRSKKSVSATGNVKVSGAMKVKGDLDSTETITVSGASRVDGSVTANQGMKVSGRAVTGGSLKSDGEIEVRGWVKVGGNVVAQQVKFKTTNEFRRLFKNLWRSQIEGAILGRELVDVDNIQVDGNIRGKVVKIGQNSRIDGTVQYVDDLILANDVELRVQPVRISLQDLGRANSSHITIREKIQIKEKVPSAEEPIKLKFCPKCGQDVGESKKYCAACGSRLE